MRKLVCLLLVIAVPAFAYWLETLGTRVTLSPQQGFSPLEVRIRAVIDRPTEDWYCPELKIVWTDGTETKRESDCDPWNEIPTDYRYSETVTRLLGQGRHDITVTLKQGKREMNFPLWAEVY